MLEIQCPQCQRMLKVPDKYVGTEGACNYCGGRIQVQSSPVIVPVMQEAVVAPSQVVVPSDALDQGELVEAHSEIDRLTAEVDSERAGREKAEVELGEARTQIAELAAAVAAAEQQCEAVARTELERLEGEVARARGEVEALNKELEVHRTEKARSDAAVKRAEGRLAEVRERIMACLEDLPERVEAEQRPVSVGMAASPIGADAAAMLVCGGKGERRGRWAWIVGLGLVLLVLVAAAGLYLWPRLPRV